MDSKDDNERDSSISYNEFMNNVRGGIIPPPPPQVWASAINDDATPPRDIGLSAIPDRHVDPSSMIQPLSSNSNDALDPARSATASNEAISQPSAPTPHLMGGMHFEESGQDLDRMTLLSPLISSSPTYVATEEEITHPVNCDERSRDGEENMEEAEDDYAPLPPETIAASFEARKPELTEDNVGASILPEQIAAPSEGHGDEEEILEEDADDSAPLPPETIAASFDDNDDTSIPPGQIAAPFEGHGNEEETRLEDEDHNAPPTTVMLGALFNEAAMPEFIDIDSAPLPPDMVAASFEGHSDEEEKHEEAEDDGAPAPPEMVALSYEVNDDTKQEAKQNSEVIEDTDGANINNAQGIIDFINTSLPPETIPASFEGYGNEEEKREEVEDHDAPVPPEMIAASYEANDDANGETKRNQDLSLDVNNTQVAAVQTALTQEAEQDVINSIFESGTGMPDTSAVYSFHGVVGNNETSPRTGSFSITSAYQRGDDPSLLISGQGHVEIAIYPNLELMSRLHPSNDPGHQSLPLLEGTLVQDLPEEPVYDAYPFHPTGDNYVWSMRAQKYRIIILGWVLLATAGIIAVVAVVFFSNANDQTGSDILIADPNMTSTTSSTIVQAVYPTTTPEISPVSQN